ncbi:integrase family protein [Rhodoferax ferrireducens]|uniref:gamma-mobile-trio integrase GmtZ n=1 Tax=Rhodoferax ferrireducens TaxID=192843 RepID=UPI00298E24D1|nr:integrase family protein [Rhodoferax ferrireducens]WPC68318.1 integrase family protein [Rhodoferax ferrireducens]
MAKKNNPTDQKFDPEFGFLLAIDPAFEEWRALVAEWYASQKYLLNKGTALSAFFVRYLHAQSLDKHPAALFDASTRLPDLWETLELDRQTEMEGKKQHDTISDFLDWVLRTQLAPPDADGHQVVPAHLRNPFPRMQTKRTGKVSDITFSHVLAIDSRMLHWQDLAAEWLGAQKSGVAHRRLALDKFLLRYILECDLPRHPLELLKRSTPKPNFSDTILKAKKRGAIGSLGTADIEFNSCVADFLDWVLIEKLSIEDDHGHRIIPVELHNPVARLPKSGIAAPTETTKSSLSIRYIKELRTMLAEGPNLRDWKWAQQSMDSEWFVVDPQLVNPDDPDCVWRERNTTANEQEKYKLPSRVTELWSPVRAVALYVKLELPLRTFQVRMLDSGEADTWRYVHGSQGGSFVLNDSALATGSATRPYQRGVFHRSANEAGAGLFINTNKTADINKPESAKGYVVPWAHEAVLYWLDKLRHWQERYNPIQTPMAWGELERKHFGRTPPHPEVLAARGTACFLFRDAAASGADRQKPLTDLAIHRPWYLLLAFLEKRCAERGETLDDGTPIEFVEQGTAINTYYPPHALRVSLISYLVLDLQLPIAVVSKLIAGHARIIMTLYYTKFGHAYMKEVLDLAERNTLAADQASHRRFLMDATMDQVSQRFASVSVDALRAAIGQKSAAGFVFEDKGICPVGGSMCDVGGKCIKERQSELTYAPVPGYPHERNCVRCRFFLSGPAFLPGLQAHFNTVSYEAHERSERHNDLHEEVTLMENRRADCERDGQLFTEHRELERLSQRYEAEAEAMGKLVNDMQATYHLIGRSLEILKGEQKEGVQLVAVGAMTDIQTGFIQTPSELHQIEVLCENAVIYPETDARKPVLQRSQLLDCMLEFNKMRPVFFRLKPKQQLAAGNAVIQLIQARTGSLKGALDYVEGLRRLRDLGIVDETWDVIAEKVAGTPARQIIDAARKNRTLPGPQGDKDAS